MRTATYRTSSYRARGQAGSRLVSTLLALAIAVLIVLALLRMGGVLKGRPGDGRPLSTFDVTSEGASQQKSVTRNTSRERQTAKRADRPVPRPRVDPVRPVPPVPDPILHLPGVMILNRADYAASDIGSIRGTAAGPPAAPGGNTGRGDDSESVGAGPGGEPLYAAEWYRRPTRAETSTYMPRGKVGWGMIACRTAARYHVEDCVELGETPGSGISRGLRQAAWQFLVRPPRKGGAPMIGAWVRIRFDLTSSPSAGAGADDD